MNHQPLPAGISVPTRRRHRRRKRKYTVDRFRWFLVLWMAVLTLLIFFAYFYTKDIRVWFAGTCAASAVGIIYPYYFCRQQRRRKPDN